MEKYLTFRKEVIACCRWLWEQGYFGSQFSAVGNVSVRVPGQPLLVITPSGQPYMELSPADICVVDFKQNQIDGKLAPSMETAMHIGVYESRSDVGAVVHTHQPYASVFSLINQKIPSLFDEVVLSVGESVDVVPYALSGSDQLVENVKKSLSNGCYCYILQNHGALSLGKDLTIAWKNAELLEKTAKAYYRALSTGKPVTFLSAEDLDRLRNTFLTNPTQD